MSRFLLALRCFFAVLFLAKLPPDAVKLLPPPDLSPPKLPPPPEPAPAPAPAPVVPPVSVPVPVQAQAQVQPPKPEPVAAPAPEPVSSGDRDALRHRGAVQLLTVLQREGRLLDFLMEDITSYGDAQIGAAVRDIHRGCKKGLAEHVKVAAIRPEPDEAVVKVPAGHDPSQIRLIGSVTGRPPFEGTLRHHGWRAQHINLTDLPAGHDPTVICPAEVEIGA